MEQLKKHRCFVLTIGVFAALLIHYVFFKSTDLFGPHDGKKYHELALAAVSSHIGACQLYEHSYWTPLWIETIAAIYRIFGENPKHVHAFILLVIFAQATLLYKMSTTLWSKGAVAAPILFLASSFVFKHSSYLQYELFLGFMISFMLFLLLKILNSQKQRLWLSGLLGLLLYATLLISAKAIFVVLFIFIVLLLKLDKKRYTNVLATGIAFAIPLSLWVARNFYCHNEFIPLTTNGGVVFYIGNNPNTDYSGYNDPYASVAGTDKSTKVYDQKKWYELGKNYIKAHPAQFLERFVKRFFLFFNPHYGDQIIGIILFILALYKFIKIRRSGTKLPLIITYSLFAIFSFAIMHAIYLYGHRYVLPVWPFISLLAAGVFSNWKFQNRSAT